MAITTGFRHLFDFCSKVEGKVDEVRDSDEDDAGFIEARKDLLKEIAKLERRFGQFTVGQRTVVGASVIVLEHMFYEPDEITNNVFGRASTIHGALQMAKVLLKSKPRRVYNFLESFYAFLVDLDGLQRSYIGRAD